jgi:hypothetical protein
MNTMNNEAQDLQRQDLEALLPWHAAGTLNRRDSERVEAALASDRELARRYDLVREELGETILLNETLGAPSARAMQKLFAAIDAEKAPRRRASFNLSGRIAEFFAGFAPRTLAYAATAAAVVLLIQAAVIGSVMVNQFGSASYQVANIGTTDGSLAMVRFAPQATSAEITAFLEANKASVVDGPERGLYKIRLAVTGLPKEELAKIFKRMQDQSKAVEFIAVVQ